MNLHSRYLHAAQLCNCSLGEIGEKGREEMAARAAEKLKELFDILQIDHRNDHNTRETPQRVARMLVEDLLVGRFTEPPRITEFDNANRYEQMIVTGPIEVRSTCAHHMMPIYGSAWIGVLPSSDGKIVGLSKYDRIVEYFCRRMQIQEELVQQIGEYIVDKTSPRGLAVRVSAVHMCKTHRGVRASHHGKMVNAFYYGEMQTDPALRSEFLEECRLLERGAAA
jgi:GTP cyclohydrolase I